MSELKANSIRHEAHWVGGRRESNTPEIFKYSGKLRASNEIPFRSGEGFVVAIGCPIWSFYASCFSWKRKAPSNSQDLMADPET